MSIIPQINPFGAYVKQHLTSLQGQIEKWLAGFEKTLDDVAWWEMTGEEVKRYQFFSWYVHATVMFAGSDEKHKKTFLWEPRVQELLESK